MRILKPKAFQGENMLRQLLLTCISIYIASETWKLLRHTSRGFTEKRAKRYRKTGGEDIISALPDDLLVHILMFVPTKDVVATMTLSKRWRFVWTMVPQLVFREINYGTHDKRFIGGLLGRLFGKSDQLSICQFLHKSLQLHKAPVLQILVIELGPRCPIDIDVGNCIASAVERRVRVLCFELTWSAEPTGLPKSLYTCDSLYCLSLSAKIFLDVPSSACLPSLQHLTLYSVVYKDEDSHARFLSSCPILKYLVVKRHHKDNVTRFIIKVTSLESLVYDNEEVGGVQNGSLVIDCPALQNIFIRDFSGGSCSIENEPHFVEATIHLFGYPDEKFIRSLSSVIYLELVLDIPTVVCCEAINFSQLIESKIALQIEFDWMESLMLFLHNSPNLKVLFIQQVYKYGEDFPLSWKQPSSVPGCLSNNLEIFEWKDYGGRSEEKQVVRYIFDNSKSLKRIGISMKSTCNRRDQMNMKKELECMPRVSTSSQLLFFTQLDIWKVWKFKL